MCKEIKPTIKLSEVKKYKTFEHPESRYFTMSLEEYCKEIQMIYTIINDTEDRF